MRTCPDCGANLDSGERCDCEMEGREKQNGAGTQEYDGGMGKVLYPAPIAVKSKYTIL